MLFTYGLSVPINKPIKIVYNTGTPPLKFKNKQNQATGMLIDIWKLWSAKTGKKIEFIEANWDDTLLMVKDGRVDIHGGLYYTKKRDKYLDYTSKPLYENKNYFFYYKGITQIYNNEDILPFVVGIGNGFPRKFMKENYPNVLIKKYDSNEETLQAIKNSEVKVVLSSLATFIYSLKSHQIDINDFKYVEDKPAFTKEYFGAVKAGNKKLLKLIDDGFEKISNQELKDIELKWTKNLDANPFMKHKDKKFTKKEKQWLQNNKTIKIVANPSWPPFSFINKDTNKPDGIAADYMKLIAKETGINFEYVRTSSWDESIKKIQNKEIDIFGVIKQTPQRDKYLNFTDTYITFPMVAVTKNDISFVSSIDDIKNKKFAMIKNFSSTEYLKTNYPNLDVTLYLNAQECMEAVSDNKADVFIGSLGTVSYLLKKYEYVNLKIAGKIGITSSWGIGVRNDMEPEIISIFNKVLHNISEEKKDKILNRWISIKFDEQIDYTIIYELLILFVFFVVGTLYWNRKLSIAKKAVDESEIKTRSIVDNSQDALIVIDTDSKIVMWNNAATTIFGFIHDEMIGKSVDSIIPSSFKKLHFEGVSRVRSGGKQNLIGKGAIEIEGVKKDGSIIPIDLTLNTYIINSERFFSANIRDISERKALTIALEEEKVFINSIINAQDNFVITSDGQYIRTVNKAFCNFYNVKDVAEFIDKFGNCICDTFDTTVSKDYIQKVTDDEIWIDYVYNRPNHTHKVIIMKGDEKYIFTITADKFYFKGKELKVSVFTDVTDMEAITQEIKEIHKHTKESIEYASLIQGALVPEDNVLNGFFKDSFVIWQPKDIVGGDIWLFSKLRHEDECLLMFIDCTGHGVPGAFVTMIVKAIEREVVLQIKADRYNDIDVSPASIMSYFNKTTKTLLKQTSKDSLSNAGWDGGIIYYNRRTQILKFAGAETPLFYIDKNQELKTIKGNRYSVGYKKCSMDYEYKETIIEVTEGMKFYCTTDGYLDQNGGEKDFPFGKKRFGNIIKKHHTETMVDQQEIFLYEMDEYENMVPNNDRNDDVTLIGFEISSESISKEDTTEEIVKYEGVMTQNVISTCMDNIESKIENMSIRGVISIIIIEYCQNMMNYSKSISSVDINEIVPAGEIEVQNVNDEYYEIMATNIVSVEDKEKLMPKLVEIKSLDKAGIRKRYRELRKSGENTHSKGGGIGIYEIAKISDGIEYKFKQISEDRYYLTMKSIVKFRTKNDN